MLKFHKKAIVAFLYNSPRRIEWHKNYKLWKLSWVIETKKFENFWFIWLKFTLLKIHSAQISSGSNLSYMNFELRKYFFGTNILDSDSESGFWF